jgi:hypothetical protein
MATNLMNPAPGVQTIRYSQIGIAFTVNQGTLGEKWLQTKNRIGKPNSPRATSPLHLRGAGAVPDAAVVVQLRALQAGLRMSAPR